MSDRRHSTLAVMLAGALMATLLVGGVAQAADGPVSVAPGVAEREAARRAPDDYRPRTGVRFNHPLRPARRNVINRHLIRSINSVPRRERIRVASWNIRSDAFVNALVAAHRRGVSVRVVIWVGNASAENPNAGFTRLRKALRTASGQPAGMRSWARRCTSACRGPGGIAHTKMFLFSQVGEAQSVSMFGSANATDLAADAQWNDLYTIVGDEGLHGDLERVFAEMGRDRTPERGHQSFEAVNARGHHQVEVYPYRNRRVRIIKGDPVLKEFAKISCRGATGGTGIGGRTSIRVAMTVMHGPRGLRIAEGLRTLHDRGCNVKMVYAVLGNNVLGIFRRPGPRGPMPFRQVAQDFNGDWVYERYLHIKAWSVSGVYDGRTDAEVTFNGSANWTGLALASDEVGAKITSPRIQDLYSSWVDTLYANPPPRPRALLGKVRPEGVDPYALVEYD